MDKYFKLFSNLIKGEKFSNSTILISNSKYRKKILSNFIAKSVIKEDFSKDNLEEFEHPNLKIIKLEDGKSQIPFSSIEEGNEFLIKTPYSEKSSVLVIEDGEYMNNTAANMLLKILEEPPENSYTILLISNQKQLLSTIVSRCQIYKITKEPVSSLKERIGNSDFSETDYVFLHSLDNINYDNIISKEYIKMKEDFFDFISSKRKLNEIVKHVESISNKYNFKDNKINYKIYMAIFYSFLKDILFWRKNQNKKILLWDKLLEKDKNLDLYNNVFIITQEIENRKKMENLVNNKIYFLIMLFTYLFYKEI
ncbi:MAG TPA: hypothetical protein VKN74_00445 [Candidatus Mcinerneyibacterium sp.]|nr:hypothetical protein [Candidatus Mcinerneyibacterium sp.]